MTTATLRITLPEQVWIAHISRDFPSANFRVLSAIPGERVGYALVRIDSGAVEDILGVMASHPQITDQEVIHRSDTTVTVHFETTHPLLLFSAQRSGATMDLPVDIVDGVASVDVTGSRSHLSELGTQLKNFGLDYEIERIETRPAPSQVLSERQSELIEAAVEQGYYDSPRRCSQTELAEEVGIAKSTCSEILQRAEGAIIKDFLADIPGRGFE